MTTLIELPANPTLADICHRSALLHPTLLAETLKQQARDDIAFALDRCGSIDRSARARARHCRTGADAARTYDSARDSWSLMPLGVQIVTAGAAAKLQCLPRHILTQAAIRTDKARSSKTMTAYRVTCIIDIEADSPEDAAREALRIQRDPASIATVFDVCRKADLHGETTETFDLEGE